MNPTDFDGQVEFPSISAGVTLLSMEERATGALQSLILDHLLLHEGDAYWIDSRNNATTTTLANVAPSMRILDRIHVARAFTPFQHYSIVEDLPGVLTSDVSMIVLPDIDWFYDEDELRTGEGASMLRGVFEIITTLASTHDLPVVVSSSRPAHAPLVDQYVDTEIECTLTKFGPRFSGEDFETLLFECDTGVQTTLAFWRRVLQSRHPTTLQEPTTEVGTVGTH